MSTTPNSTDIAAAAAAGCRGYPIWCDVSGAATMFISNPPNGKFVLSRVTDGAIMGEFQTLALAEAFAAQTSSNTAQPVNGVGVDTYISSQRSATNPPPNPPSTWFLDGVAYTSLSAFLAAGGSI